MFDFMMMELVMMYFDLKQRQLLFTNQRKIRKLAFDCVDFS
jgi:hypothetical protein